MNPHQNTQIKNIQKVVICSHDRLQENNDTSDFSVELGQQVTDITEFKLNQAIIPLSSYTFNKDDDDRTLDITTVERPARIRNTIVNTPYFLNFAYYTRPFNSGAGYGSFSPSEMLRVRNDGLFKQAMDAGQQGSIALRIFNSVSEANSASYLILYNLNSTKNYATIAQDLQNHCSATGALNGYDLRGLRFRDNWQTPYNENADAQNEFGAQTVFSHPDASDDPGRDVIYFYNKNANQDFTVSIGWFYFNSATSKYDIPVPGGSIFVNMNGISTKTSIGHYIYGIRPPAESGWSNYKQKIIGFFNTIYTNTSLVAHLNSQMSDYDISWSKVQNGDIVNLDKLVLNPPAVLNTGYRRIDAVYGDVICFRRLGYKYTLGSNGLYILRNDGVIGPWENNMLTFQPTESINIYYEIKCAIIQVQPANTPNAYPEIGTSNGTHLFSDLIQQVQFKNPFSLDYPNMNINLELVNDPTASNAGYYSLKMSSPDTSCRRLELRIDDKLRQIYVPTEGDYFYKLAPGVPNTNSTVASGLLFQPYFTNSVQITVEKNIWWPNNLPSTTTVSFKTDTMYTETELLTDIQVVTALVPNLLFTLVEHKLKIQNTSENVGYIFSANERLGWPSDITIGPLSTYTASELIDVSSLNDVIYIALPDLYQDGKNSYNSFRNLSSDVKHQRPIISSIVCSIWNNADVQYGKYVSYKNDSDSWMRSTRKDLKTMKVQILDSEYRIIDLNQKAVHLELDFR